jgi:hypothetical protein
MTTHPITYLQKTAVARAVWLIVAVGTLVVLVTAVPLRYQMLLGDFYGFGAPLAEMGISLRFFAIYFTFFELLLSIGSWAVGVIIAWRKSGDWFALLTALTLMLIGFMPPLMDALIWANASWTMPVVLLRSLCFTGLMVVFSLRFPETWSRGGYTRSRPDRPLVEWRRIFGATSPGCLGVRRPLGAWSVRGEA